ncbi:hypothetical protein SAMN04487904_101695 [Actinopolyspora lacussalsi subsp. righensis]|uniref:Uncharacterized protein n=1 Tax=Actinopolyspora righensis TaxID=995060 RepID=A0A1I6XKZ3_9ACTN|nr:DUF6084 family protein [Actinopolyspora righensis]SFT38767.1 hypothetical protein SAMN04487904_101695 [Actinopolyspora righensis]
MADLSVTCEDVRCERYGAGPTLLFRLRIDESGEDPIHAVSLRCAINIEPRKRDYDSSEEELLGHLFGGRDRWGHTLRNLRFANVATQVPGFTDSIRVDVPVPCTFDMEVASGKYLHSLRSGSVPMVLMFSGTVFGKGTNGFWVHQIPWELEADYAMPIEVWQRLKELYFPRADWIRLHRDTVDALLRYQSQHAIPTWDAAIGTLLDNAGEVTP